MSPGRATSALIELIDVVPTVHEPCGAESPANVQGRLLVPLLRGEAGDHREHVISEYADNAEVMVRMCRWKLIDCVGNQRRRDRYALDGLPSGQTTRLLDLAEDPGEMGDVALLQKNRAIVGGLVGVLANRLVTAVSDPDWVPGSDDLHSTREHCLPPRSSRFRDLWCVPTLAACERKSLGGSHRHRSDSAL